MALIDSLIEIFCQQGTQSQCSQFLSAYPDITQQLVWLVFFPTVFLLIFINVIASGVTTTSAKYKTLVAIAIYIFIIFQGWYHYFLNVSKFWFIAIIVLGGIFVLIKKMGPASGGGGGGGERHLKASGSTGKNWLKEALIGEREINPLEIARNTKLIKDEIILLKQQKKIQEDLRGQETDSRSRAVFNDKISILEHEIATLENLLKAGRRKI